jgi:hypothetical protein
MGVAAIVAVHSCAVDWRGDSGFAYSVIRMPDTVITTPAGEHALASEQAQRRNPK